MIQHESNKYILERFLDETSLVLMCRAAECIFSRKYDPYGINDCGTAMDKKIREWLVTVPPEEFAQVWERMNWITALKQEFQAALALLRSENGVYS